MRTPEEREYRVVWKRIGYRKKVNHFATRAGADRFLMLFGPEPWKAYGKEAESRWCCSGDSCACFGITEREHSAEKRAEMPALEYVRLETRPRLPWSPDV